MKKMIMSFVLMLGFFKHLGTIPHEGFAINVHIMTILSK